MSKKTRSARGDSIDFDLLAIKQQLATTPTPTSVDARRRFIDAKDGVKTKTTNLITPAAKQAAVKVDAPENVNADTVSLADIPADTPE